MSSESIEALVMKIQEVLLGLGLQIVVAVIILLIGLQVAKFGRKLVKKAINKAEVDPILANFLGNATYVSIIALVTIIALGQIGIKTASFIAVLGSAGLAIGLALQGSLSNLAAGMMLILFRPFKVGDYIEGGGDQGTVKEIQLFSTILTTIDNRRIIIPNSKVFGSNIINYSAEETRRIDLVFGIGYGDDLGKAKQVIQAVLSEDKRILSEPQPSIGVLELADSSVNLAVRPWVKTSDYWPVYFSLQEKMKLGFDAEGINIPFPQRDVHIFNN